MSPLTSRIPAVLSWRAPADPRGDLRRRARAEIRARLERLLARGAPPQEVARLLDAIDALPAAGRRRLFGAPELCGRVIEDLDLDLSFFLDVTRAEHLSFGRVTAGTGPVWTALGDRRFEESCCVATWRAPRLPQGPILDATSPWATARIPFVVETFAPYSDAELASLVARLREAAALLRARCPAASALFRTFTATIVLRRDPDAPESYLSESTEGYLGRIVLVNAHLPQADAAWLVESLVHEAVHSYLSTLELFEPLLPDRDAAAALVLISPWTGARLDAQRFVHAALVWYAVGALWAGLGQPERARGPRAGWASSEMRENLALLRGYLSPEARALFAAIAAQAIDGSVAAPPRRTQQS